jgi:hypothetical protein
MKKSILLMSTLSLLVGTTGAARADYYFDFEDNTNTYGLLPGLESYMEGIFGSDIALDNVNWWGESYWYDSYESDIIYTPFVGRSSTIDFDPLPAADSAFALSAISFTWMVRTDSFLGL